MGWVEDIGPVTPWDESHAGPLSTVLWERAIKHSITPQRTEGFLLPYHELLAKHGDGADLSKYVAMVPDDHWDEFSYGSELVTQDGAIGALLEVIRAVEAARSEVPGPWDTVLEWCDARLNEAWKARGPAPGLGSALVALGVERGNILANRIVADLDDNTDPWPAVAQAFADGPAGKGPGAGIIHETQAKMFAGLPDTRRKLLRLIASFALSDDQASRLYDPQKREKAGIDATDADLLANPYALYELDRNNLDPLTVTVVDRGVFPDDVVRDQHPLPLTRPVSDPTDPRRVRAFAVDLAEKAAEQGSTLVTDDQLYDGFDNLSVAPACPVTVDLMPVVSPHFSPLLQEVDLHGQRGWQLDRYVQGAELIRRTVNKRLKGRRHDVTANWRKKIDEALKQALPTDPDLREEEELARNEKAKALEELAASRFGVLIGPAGTGKTTLLEILCGHDEIKAGEVLLLAPTGKARVQMQERTGLPAKTIAQFLLPLDRYVAKTGQYRTSSKDQYSGEATVIVDESSMLTEDQLVALLDALKGVQRLILVGDHRQLPPIGAGRPFVDIIKHLREVGRGLGELTIPRRQQVGEGVAQIRSDLQLANWFTDQELEPGADAIWAELAAGKGGEFVSVHQWDTEPELEALVLQILEDRFDVPAGDANRFAEKLAGATVKNGHPYYNLGAAKEAEQWQILGPMHGRGSGVAALNRLIQRQFRTTAIEFARDKYMVPSPMGVEQIVYGDKVMCVRNNSRKAWNREDGRHDGYVANGEIGVAIGRFAVKGGRPYQLHVEFSSQAGDSYTFTGRDFSTEGTDLLQLAYAVTVHKAQGSQFRTTILVLPNPCMMLSPELLYTALTRQQDHVVILHQGPFAELKAYAAPERSVTASRLTNLFEPSKPITVEDRVMDDRLVHRTARGEFVRSKSEVIVANLLHQEGVNYQYEEPFVGKDGTRRIPDFTIVDDDSGETFFWEHLGMLGRPSYRERWEAKMQWYGENGVFHAEIGGGPRGTLLTSEDTPEGHLDSAAILEQIRRMQGE